MNILPVGYILRQLSVTTAVVTTVNFDSSNFVVPV